LSAAAFDISGPPKIIDGDSIRIGREELRLQGIDAPEGQQNCTRQGLPWRCGQAAAEALETFIAGAAISCHWEERDHYDRALATCYVDDTNINAVLVERGMALAYPSHSGPYAPAEKRAMRSKAGIWAAEFETPSAWRRAARKTAKSDANCAVKGNVNRQGNRIYHVKGGQDYARVRINAGEGDQCFDSEQAAKSAGFRAAKR